MSETQDRICQSKRVFGSFTEAERFIARHDAPLTPYTCPSCHLVHLTSR